ncbi:RNI-like protein [Gonapodya prolifera JEL478]|uniref:RNI-like protein n=1 Tax=Gonapodya prolifera (strain JEL478) TaxID=1344416 RepID=A0A139ASD4_GONPJ|nr:RNI-like protein [Gonapodya prolifera JEL478]|eukprot:KXS19660.1 RNI-like protein [Gonapodya prolifera JEL478]
MSAGLHAARVPEFWEVDPSEIEWSGAKLGRGGFGSVYRDLDRTLFRSTQSTHTRLPGRTTRTFSADYGPETGGYSRKDFDREAFVWYTMASPFVLPLYGIGNDVNGNPFFVSPIMENGNAEVYLKRFKEKCNGDDTAYHKECLGLLYDVVRGMVYLHRVARVTHTDLKPGNVLVTSQGWGVITDFGFAQLWGDEDTPVPGTLWYLPPERLGRFLGPSDTSNNNLNHAVTNAGDVYAFGIMMWVFWTLSAPYICEDTDDVPEVFGKVLTGLRPAVPGNMPEDVATLMQRCWTLDPEERPSFEEIVAELERILPELGHLRPVLSNAQIFEFDQMDAVNDADESFRQAQTSRDRGDLSQALCWYKRSADLGLVDAQYEFADWCRVGLGLHHRDVNLATEWYKKASTQGHPPSLCTLGDFYSHGVGSCSRDLERAIKYYRHAADEGHVIAQTRLGFMLMHRYGFKWDYKEAVKWFEKAAEQNFALAKVLLAECYLLGLGVETNLAKAESLLATAAAARHADAQFNMGMLCESRKDFNRARQWYEDAVKQGHAGAMTHLGDLYLHGIGGLPQDQKKAAEWYHTASDLGHQGAFQRLSHCYNMGIGVDQDLDLASLLLRSGGGLQDSRHRFDINNLGFQTTPFVSRVAPRIRKAIEEIWDGAQSINLSRAGVRLDNVIGLVDTLQANTTVISLDITRNMIGDEGVKTLSKLLESSATLVDLKLWDSNFGFEGAMALATALKTNSSLTHLWLHRNQIGDHGANALAEALHVNVTLTNLALHANGITDEGAKGLAEMLKINTALLHLDLSHNGIADEGTMALAEALKMNSVLSKFNLLVNCVSTEGAKALADMLKTNTTVTILFLQENKIGDDGAEALADALSTNTSLQLLSLQGNEITSTGAKILAEVLKTNAVLTVLDLQRNKIGDDGTMALAEALMANTTLVNLALQGEYSGIGKEGAKALAEALKINTTLVNLDLSTNGIGDEGAKALAETLKSHRTGLTHLNLSDNGIGDDQNVHLRALATNGLTIDA